MQTKLYIPDDSPEATYSLKYDVFVHKNVIDEQIHDNNSRFKLAC